VAIRAEERVEDHVPLLAPFQAVLGEVGVEDLFFFAPHVALHG
jgi:hypothetical protein